MHSIPCSYCHLPAISKKETPFACSFGCELLSWFERKGSFFIPRVIISIFLYAVLLALKYFPDFFLGFSHQQILWILFILTTGMLILIGLPLFQYTIISLRNGRWMASEALMILALLIDYGHSFRLTLMGWPQLSFIYPRDYFPFFLTGIFLLVTYLVSMIEALCRRSSYKDIEQILNLRPKTARKMVKSQESTVEAASLDEGDVVKVFPGEIIPCDGIIVSGATSVDESMYLGEPSIHLKEKGDFVIGASINRDSAIQVQVTRSSQEYFLEQIIDQIWQAISRPPRIQNILEKGFPALILFTCALATFVYFYHGVVSSPKGLLSALAVVIFVGLFTLVRITPMIIALAVGRAARNGVLFRSSELFSKLAKLGILFFDKTGTLTEGNFFFSALYLEKGVNQGMALATLFSLEQNSDHPIARGVKTHPWYHEIQKFAVKDFKSHQGLGVCGIVCERSKPDRFSAVGNQRFLKRFQMQVSRFMREKIEELESMGETVILCGWEGQVRALVSFSDTLKTDVKELLERLGRLKIRPSMITGDHDAMMANLNYARGLEHIYTRCLPEEKARKIKNAQDKGQLVGMVDNTMLENEVYQQANVSIAIHTGTELDHFGCVDIAILGKRLLHLVDLIAYARRAYRTIKFSFILSLIYGVGGILLGAFGLLSPMGALLAMAFSSIVLVIFPLNLKKVHFGSTV